MPSRLLNVAFPIFLLLTGGATAEAAGVTVYRFEKVPDIDSIVVKDGKIFAAFRGATVTDAMNTFNKLLRLDLKGKTKCTKIEHVEIGIAWSQNPCLTVRHSKDGEHVIEAVNKFDFGDNNDSDYNDFLKGEDFVKERRFTFHFSVRGKGCEVNVTKRSYVPVDGDKPIQSRTGPGVCRLEQH